MSHRNSEKELDDLPEPEIFYLKPFNGNKVIKPIQILSDEKAWHRLVVDEYDLWRDAYVTQERHGQTVTLNYYGKFSARKIRYSRVTLSDYTSYCKCQDCRKEKRSYRKSKIILRAKK